jgi:hypothetical protein
MSFFSSRRVPARMPGGFPPNFKGIENGREQLVSYINGPAGGVPLDPIGFGIGALTSYVLPSKMLKGLWGFLRFDCFESPEKPNKFTLRGCINFSGEYPAELLAARKKVR